MGKVYNVHVQGVSVLNELKEEFIYTPKEQEQRKFPFLFSFLEV